MSFYRKPKVIKGVITGTFSVAVLGGLVLLVRFSPAKDRVETLGTSSVSDRSHASRSLASGRPVSRLKKPALAVPGTQGQPSSLAQKADREESSKRSLQDYFSEVNWLNKCYQIDCGFPRTDPKSYDFKVGRELKKSLFELQSKVEADRIIDSKVASVAREFLANSDGHVKEAALHLLATQPPSVESLESILKDVISDHDAELVEHALLELERYKKPNDVSRIRAALGSAMLKGSPFVSVAIAERIGPFITKESFSFFAQVNREITNGSTQKYLRSSLEQFRRRSTGG